MKRNHMIVTLFFLGASTLLTSCNLMPGAPGEYQENPYCRTNMKTLYDSPYPTVAQIKTVQPYLKDENGNLTSNDLSRVYPFDTNLLYIRYASEYLPSYKEVMKIESLTGKYTVECHQLFDRHYYYLDENNKMINNLKVINDSYGTNEWISVDKRLIEVLKMSKEMTTFSKGKYNLFVGELSTYWNYYLLVNNFMGDPSESIDPAHSDEEKNNINNMVINTPKWNEIDDVLVLDETNNRVKFNKYYPKNSTTPAEKVSITLGGIGKGYLSENLYLRLKENNLTKGLVYSGSSSLVFMDKNVTASPWKISLSNPYYYLENYVGILNINEKLSLSTSGSQVQRYTTIVDDKVVLRQHIIDPTTGYPSSYYPQITLLSKTISSTVMDTLSTILINCSLHEISQMIKNINDTYGDLGCIFYECDLSLTNDDRSIKLYVSKSLKDSGIFEEYVPTTSSYIPVTYEYLE